MKKEPAVIIGSVVALLVFGSSFFGVHVSTDEQQAIEQHSNTIYMALVALIPLVQSIVTRGFVEPAKPKEKGPPVGPTLLFAGVLLLLVGCAAVKPIAVSAEQMLCAQYRSGERFITPEQALQLGCTLSESIPWKAEAERALRSGARSLPAVEK